MLKLSVTSHAIAHDSGTQFEKLKEIVLYSNCILLRQSRIHLSLQAVVDRIQRNHYALICIAHPYSLNRTLLLSGHHCRNCSNDNSTAIPTLHTLHFLYDRFRHLSLRYSRLQRKHTILQHSLFLMSSFFSYIILNRHIALLHCPCGHLLDCHILYRSDDIEWIDLFFLPSTRIDIGNTGVQCLR